MQVGVHARGRLVGDLNGVLQDALGDDVVLSGGRGLRTDEDPELWVAVLAVLLQLLLQGTEPLGHQVDVLVGRKDPLITGICLNNYQEGGLRRHLALLSNKSHPSMSLGIPSIGDPLYPAIQSFPSVS